MECDSGDVIAILCARHADMDAIRRQIGLRHGSSPVSYGVDISDPERSLGAHGGFIAAFAFVPPPVDYIRVHESHGATVWNGMYRWQFRGMWSKARHFWHVFGVLSTFHVSANGSH